MDFIVYIPESCEDYLRRYGFDLSNRRYKIQGNYYVFTTHTKARRPTKRACLQAMGAVLARCGVNKNNIGFCVTYIMDNNGYVEYLYSTNPLLSQLQSEPKQLAFEILNRTPYDGSSHLTPDGKRKRRR